MAEVFKHLQSSLTTINETLYTAPANTTSIIFFAQAANKDVADSSSVTIQVSDYSQSTTKFLAKDIVVPARAAAVPIGGKLVLEAGDNLQASAGVNNFIDIVFSILEIS
jgi:hypothetical protein